MGFRLATRVKARLRLELLRWCRRNNVRPPDMLLTGGDKFAREVASKLTSKDAVIDLGAHVGIMSMEFARYAGTVYAFEPHPRAFAQLKKNTAKFQNIVALNKAASTQSGSAVLFSAPDVDGKVTEGSSLSAEKVNISKEHSFTVETVSLAEFIDSLPGNVSLIKMDIEGAEYDIIESLLDAGVMDKIGIVYVEDHCDRIPGLAQKRAAIVERIGQMGLESKFDFTWH